MYYLPIYIRGAETQAWTKRDVRTLKAEDMKFYQSIKKLTGWDKI